MSDEKDKEILVEKVRELVRQKGDSPELWPDDANNTATALKELRYLSDPLSDEEAKQNMSARSRRTFLVGGAAALIGVFGWRWMSQETKTNLLQSAFRFNERVSQFFYKPTHLAKEFPPSAITPARVNSDIGMTGQMDAAAWSLTVSGLRGMMGDIVLTLDDIKALPRTEMITEFKCIEGWSYIAKWAGVRFSDFANHYGGWVRPEDYPRYVGLETPDAQYFVGWDIEAIMHPQTLLAYELNDEPLSPEHGAPLRIASPTKYGIKQIKRIGRIEFTNERPRDYWALPENGYDWYSGH